MIQRVAILTFLALAAILWLGGCDRSAETSTAPDDDIPDVLRAEIEPGAQTSAVTTEPASAEPGETQAEAVTSEEGADYDVPVALHVVPSRTQYLLGEPVQVYISVENLTDEPVVFRSDYFPDKSLTVMITPESGQQWQYIDHRRAGIIVPSRSEIPPHGSRGFFNIMAHSEVDGHPLPFPQPGLYRLDFALVCEINEDPHLETIIAEPVTLQVVEPATAAERFLSDTFTQPWLAQAVQERQAPAEMESLLLDVAERAPSTVFAEHAHFLLGEIYGVQEEWLRSNEHLYEVYYSDSAYYPKKMILTRIFSNFHFGGEPERALAVLRVMLQLYPDMRDAQNQLVNSYISQYLTDRDQ